MKRPDFKMLPAELTLQHTALGCSEPPSSAWITQANASFMHSDVALFMLLGCANVWLVDPTGQTLHGWDFGGEVTNSIMNPETGRVSALMLCVCDFLSGIDPKNPDYLDNYFQEQDWDGTITFNCKITLNSEEHSLVLGSHHLFTLMPNGNFLTTYARNHTTAEDCEGKYGFDDGEDEFGQATGLLRSDGCVDDGIIEVKYNPDQVNGEDCEIVWEWWSFDHSVQEGHPNAMNYGKIADSPEKISLTYMYPTRSEGTDYVPHEKGEHEPMHFNSITYYEEKDLILFGSFYKSELYFIDHSTTSEEAMGTTGGNYGQGGNILYRYGNPAAYEGPGQQQFHVAHGTDIKTNEDGSLQIVAHNNGLPIDMHGACNQSGIFTFTVRFDEEGNFIQNSAEAPLSNDFEWFVTSPDGEPMCSFDLGGAKFLENGHMMMTFPGEVGMDNAQPNPYAPYEVIEVTPQGDTTWRMLRNYQDLSQTLARSQLYQTEFYPRDSPAFKTYGVVRD